MLRWIRNAEGLRRLQEGRTLQTIHGEYYTEWSDVKEVAEEEVTKPKVVVTGRMAGENNERTFRPSPRS